MTTMWETLKKRPLVFYALLLLCTMASSCVILIHSVFPKALFRKVVLNPIPLSVGNIRASGFFMPETCHTYVLRFQISPGDISQVLSSRPFTEIQYVDYKSGILSYGHHKFQAESYARYRGDQLVSTAEYHDPIGLSFMLFEGWRKWFTPRWFQFDGWCTFKAYVVEKKDTDTGFCEVFLLLHNPDISEAYFIDYQTRLN